MKHVITSSDNYNLLKDIIAGQNRIEDKMDLRMDKIEARQDKADERMDGFDGFKMQILLLGSLVVFVTTLFKDFVISKLFGKS